MVAGIRKAFAEVNAGLSGWKKVKKELMESTEGGELTAYYDEQGNLRKMVVANYGEMGKSIEEYYFSDGKLFFVFEQQFYYTAPIYTENSKVERVDEQRYYFYDDSLIRWLSGKQQVSELKFPEREAEVLDEAKRLEAMLEE